MTAEQPIYLTRDCEATLIPSGEAVVLPQSSEVFISQSLGGSYTVICEGRLARIAGTNADALGLKTEAARAAAAPDPASLPTDEPVDEKLVWDQMRTCYDPEIPVNIVDLGLVYDCHIAQEPGVGNCVQVKMTLTAPGCGMGAAIAGDVESKIRSVPGVADVRVELVWDPPWNQAMMTEAARLQLGLY